MASVISGFFRRTGRSFVEYWQRIGNDYRTVAKETVEGCVEKPFKAGLYFAGLGGLIYAYRTNPSEESMMNDLRERRQVMTLLPPPIHNKESDDELAERSVLLCQNRLHYYNLWFFSLLVRSPYDSSATLIGAFAPPVTPIFQLERRQSVVDGVFVLSAVRVQTGGRGGRPQCTNQSCLCTPLFPSR
ncbi:hypothetical protein Y032_0103g3565 [Ancylostoma ceylanicum]|uniref:Uncharacterized protein n=1 Tax=Ancylostoma ceylanicum TaxID=53326 RepID=A0A016TH32_9BILA|nr:hypothetical protein Y032_0103g3565 [Ancylostoma ceylanicum]